VSYVLNSDDCDDTSRFVYPGAIEIPSDGMDSDCNGVDATTVPTLNDWGMITLAMMFLMGFEYIRDLKPFPSEQGPSHL